MSSSKGSSKYKSTFGSLGGGTSDSKSSSKSKETERSSSKRDESSRRTKDIEEEKKSSSKSKSTRYEESESKSRSHRDRDRDRDEEKSSRHRSRQKENGDDDYKKSSSSKKSHSRKDDDEEDERKDHRRSSKHREDRDESKKHREHKSDSHRRHRDRDDDSDREAERNGKADEKEEEPNYEDDFDDDFEKDESSEEEVKKVPEKKSSSSKEKSSSRKTYDSDKDDDEYKSRRDDKRKSSEQRSRNKYADYDDYADEENYRPKGRVVKANAHVNVPTDLVEVYSSEIYFNHDSRDRQKRRAKDLFKSIIELDNKSFSLLDINPVQMRTVYSSHLKHEKVQTNDDTLEIEAQTDEIETTTRWTQHPADDLKGYGIENQKFNYEASSDVLEQFRTDINVSSLQKFLQKSSKVIETLLREDISLNERRVLTENKSELDFSQGFSIFSIPKFLSKLAKTAILTNVVFAQDNMNHLVCSYDVQLSDLTSSTLLLVWDIDEPTKPYRVLICETMTTCLCYFSFIVVAGSMDGSIVLWDLRESPSLHSQNLKKINEANVIRSPTYATAGVLLEENHMSEVRSILPLQNQGKDNKDVFVQLATLEVDCKLIIWTVIELTNNVDSTVFEKDLGLLPGGRIQLVKSFEINLNNIIKTVFGRSEYQTWSLAVSTEKKNHFFISTNIGQIIHIERKGKSFSRTVMKSSYSDLSKFIKTSVDGPDLSSDGLLTVKTVSFHPEISDILLVSYGNGEIRLYDVNFATPIKTWLFLLGTEIKEARWIESRSSSFIVLNEDDSKLFVWDLLTDDTQPVLIKKTKQFGCISFPSVRTKETIGSANKDRIPFAYFDRSSQELQVHLFSPDWTRKSDKESKKFAKLIKNYILTF